MASCRMTTLICLMSWVLLSAPALGQTPAEEPKTDEEDKTFNLQRDTGQQFEVEEEEDADRERFVPAIEAGKLECAFTLGYLNLNTTLLEHEQITYKFTDEFRYWGDVKLKGESAFNPVLRLGYNVATYFAVEGLFGVSVSKYQAEITRRVARSNESGSDDVVFDPPLGEFDAENRSLITLNAGLAGVLYPFNFGGGEGRFHPYITGGLSRMWWDMNSNYTDNAAAIHLYEKFGFVIEGTKRKYAFREDEYVDAHVMARVKD